MILSSADILRILGGNQIIRLSAKIEVVEARPSISGREGLFIYIKRYPELSEFEATFTLWIESDGSEPDDLVVAELLKILPKTAVKTGLLTEITTTEFRSQNTLEAPKATPTAQADMSALEARFEALVEDVQDRMLLVHSGLPGAPGAPGKDGRDGIDGKDLNATEVALEDLADVEIGLEKAKGQVLTWDGLQWTNRYIPQVYPSGGGAGGGGLAGADAPSDGNFYVRQNGTWIDLRYALQTIEANGGYFGEDVNVDGGNFTTGSTDASDTDVIDGGNFTISTTSASEPGVYNGGLIT
jgi:hypothetical protein